MLADPPKSGGYGPGELLGAHVIAARSDPSDGGRVSLWRLPERIELTPNNYVRTALHEYGGGEWAAASASDSVIGGNSETGGDSSSVEPANALAIPADPADPVIVYSDFPSNDLRIIAGGQDKLLVPGGKYRYGSLRLDLPHGVVLAVREDLTGQKEPIDQIVSIDIKDVIEGSPSPVDEGSPLPVIAGLTRNLTPPQHATERSQVLVSGADFYACPTLSSDGRLAWVQWNHPNMPWDTTTIMVAPLSDPSNATQISTGSDESAIYPTWAPDGSLIYLSDLSGFWNFYRYDGKSARPLHQAPYDFCSPMWVPEPAPYCLVGADDKQVVIGCSWLQDGKAKLGMLRCDLVAGTSTLTEIPTDAVSATIRGSGAQSTVLLGYADQRSALAIVDWNTETITPLPLPADPTQPDLTGYISVAQPIDWDGPFGTVHAWYYPPTNKDYQAPIGELPPVQVLSHGGPTSNSLPTYNLRDVQYWTSRGIGILDVNYSGSSGYGRAYRERLKGNWGIADVEDCATGALVLVDRGLADPNRLSIRGGSAGGYTTLASLAFRDVFSAGISLYGIGDLEVLAKDTHKFESRYPDGLVGPYPERRDLYLERSPNYHLDKFNAAMLILQGLDDKVVPPQLAYAMADAIRAKGHPATLMVFEGEGHGFRKAETIIAATEAELNFLGEVYHFTPAP